MASVFEEQAKLKSHVMALQHRDDGDYLCSITDAAGPEITLASPMLAN